MCGDMAEQGLMRVVVLSADGLDPSEIHQQRSAVRRMTRVGTRGVLYDARQVEELEPVTAMSFTLKPAGMSGVAALIVRSEWTAVWKNLGFRWKNNEKNVRAFKDTNAAKNG